MSEMTYVRLCSDLAGESHLERVTVELTETDFAPPAPPLAVSAPMPAARVILVRAHAGWYGDLHPTPRRQWYINLKGRLDVEASDGEVLRMGPGDAVLLDDATGRGHRSRVIGEEDVRGVFVQLPE